MVKDTTYYDILGVSPTADDTDLKKAYRKQAIKLHPDKNGNDPKAAEKFQELGEAYGILQNKDSRALYDELGIDGMKEERVADAADIDPSEFFNMIFGGEAFKDWIGELSMLKELSQASEVLGDESGETESGAATPASAGGKPATDSQQLTVSEEKTEINKPSGHGVELTSESINKKKKQKMTREQREEIIRLHEEAKIAKQQRVDELAKTLLSKIESYEAAYKNRDGLAQFNNKLKVEFEDLKIESFGIQLLHLIGKIYTTQAQATISSSKTFGVSKIFTSVKSKSNTFKNGYSILKTAIDAQTSVEEMVREQEAWQQAAEQGIEIPEAERYRQAELERLVTGKFLATAWASTKFEVTGVLNKVCAKVLSDKTISKKERIARADALLYIGKQMSAVQRSPEEEEEARIFEEMMADATAKKSKKNNKAKMSNKDFEAFMNNIDEDEEEHVQK